MKIKNMYIEPNNLVRYEPNSNKVEVSIKLFDYTPKNNRESALIGVLKPFLDTFYEKVWNMSYRKEKWLELALLLEFTHNKVLNETSEEICSALLLLLDLPKSLEEIYISKFNYYKRVKENTIQEIHKKKNELIREYSK